MKHSTVELPVDLNIVSNSPIVGAGHELLFNLGVPAATIQHRCVALK